MKKKFGLFALVLAVLLCGSLFLLAACDETEEDPADTPATISVTVNGTAQTSGGTYSATVGTAYTFAATASNGNAVTISYVFGDAEAEELEGTSFTPTTAGSYAFTFTAEDAANFTLTLVAADAEVPQPATISVTVNGTAQTSGGTYSATVGTAYTFAATASNGNAVTISYVFGDAEAEELEGTSFTPTTAGSYAFTFTAEDAANFTLTLVAAEAEVPPAPQYTVTYKLGGHAAANAQAPTEQTVVENTQITLAAAVEAAEGYAFGGWNDGEDTYQAGTEYTVTDNVTMTAVWNVVHTHTYTWEVTQVPTDSARGSATGTCSGCEAGTDGHTTTIDLPVLTEVDAYTTNVKTPATCTVAKVTTYTYAANTQITFDVTGSVDLSVAGHGTSNLTFTAAKAATCVDDACGAYVYCSVCGKYYAVTAGTSLDDPDLAISTDAQDSASAFIDEDTATGHSYGVSYEDGIVTAACSNSGCDSSYTATVTISGGTGATGTTALSASDFTFNEQTQQFTVTLPENGYTYDGYTFSGWLVGGETYTAGQTVTVAAGNTLAIVAQWTAVNVPQISLDVKVDGQYPIETTDGGNTTACVDTNIHYAASVSEGQVTVSYTLNGGDAQSLSAAGDFTFDAAGTYIFVITAPGADDYTFTVNVKEHEWEAWEVTSAPSDSKTGEISRTCLVTDHTFSLSVPVLTEGNVTDSNEAGKYTVETVEATCTESWSATYIYNIPSEYGGGTIEAATVTLPQLEHSYGAATVDEATGNIIQTCANCPATQTLATLTGLSVGWAEGKQGWYTVGGTINASDFDVTYTYEDDVAAYEDIIKAAITNDITNTDKTATTGIKTVTFTLGGQSASIDVMVYAANETNGAKVLSAQEGTVTTTDGAAAGLTVAKIPEVSTNGLAITFRTVQMRITSTINSSDWDSAAIIGVGTAAGLNVTMPNLQANTYAPFNEQIFPQAANLFNGGVWDSFIRTVGQVVTISIDSTTGISYYSNGVLKVRYAPTDALGGSTVANFITILLGSIETEGFTFAGSGFAADDLYITYALGDSQAAALYNTVLTEVNTGTLLSGINGVTVYDSVAGGVSKYVAGPISGIADQGSTGLSISFRLDALYNAPDTRNWDDIVLGTSVELDVCLGVLEAWANTSASMAGDYNYFTPSTGSATYFRDLQTLGGYLTITLSATEGISYYYDGDLVVQYSTGTQSTQNAEVTVATLVNAIFAEIAVNGFDVCENVSVSDLLITSALTEEQAATLYNNYQSLNA